MANDSYFLYHSSFTDRSGEEIQVEEPYSSRLTLT